MILPSDTLFGDDDLFCISSDHLDREGNAVYPKLDQDDFVADHEGDHAAGSSAMICRKDGFANGRLSD